MTAVPPRFSVVVPAHQEEATIRRCLMPLAELATTGEAEIIVVVNGSTDGTAARAREYPGVIVVETDRASKSAALNLGDETASVFPRVYLDADVVVTAVGLRDLAAALPPRPPRAGSLRLAVDVSRSSWLVRAFYDVFLRMPYVNSALIGLGMYALSETGRGRFGEFPSLTGDDLFVERLFAPQERVVLQDHAFMVQAPRTAKDLMAVRTRVHFGNAELPAVAPDDERFTGSTSATSRQLLALLIGNPSALPKVAVYAGMTMAARRRARVRAARGERRWDRDMSTR